FVGVQTGSQARPPAPPHPQPKGPEPIGKTFWRTRAPVRCTSLRRVESKLIDRRPGAMYNASIATRSGGQMQKEALQIALEEARRLGADYAEARAEDRRVETLRARDAAVERLVSDQDNGWGVRAAAGGGWGFASTVDSRPAAARATAAEAVEIARASALRR